MPISEVGIHEIGGWRMAVPRALGQHARDTAVGGWRMGAWRTPRTPRSSAWHTEHRASSRCISIRTSKSIFVISSFIKKQVCRHVITETRKSERVVHHEREDYGQGSVLLLSQLPHRSFSEWNGHAFDDIAIRVTGQWQFMVHQRHMVHLTQISGMLSLFHTIDYCFFTLMSRPWHGSDNSFRPFFCLCVR